MKSVVSQCAKEVRAVLKKEFPSIKFSVTSENFSMGNSVRVNWQNGPTIEQVKSKIAHFQYGEFDGMTDCYNHTNHIENLPQTKYLQCSREVSDEVYENAFEKVRNTFSGWEKLSSVKESSREFFDKWSVWTPRDYLYRMIYKIDLTQGLPANFGSN